MLRSSCAILWLLRPYSYFVVIQRNKLLLLVTLVCSLQCSALTTAAHSQIPPFLSEESPITATLLSLHELPFEFCLVLANSLIPLQLLQTNLAISQYRRLTLTAAQGNS